ncbi:hypothetical protein EOL70_09985 [Leucothrix sargassi]|nr:hypothetical protein EOL70_09985 [Leucothrix sargassi]
MIKQRIVFCLSLLLTSVLTASEKEVPPTKVETPANSQSVEGFIPKGWEIINKTKLKDMNHDGKPDLALAILKEGTFSTDYEMDFQLLVLLGTEDGFELDYNIPVKLGPASSRWFPEMGMKRFELYISNSGKLMVTLRSYYQHNTGSSDYTYAFVYQDKKLIVQSLHHSSMSFDYQLMAEKEQQYKITHYDFAEKTKTIANNRPTADTYFGVCSRDASEEDQKKCPKAVEKTEPLTMPKSFKYEITHFNDFPYDPLSTEK